MIELASFLGDYPPFDSLTAAELESLAATATMVEFSSGDEIVNGFVDPVEQLSVVVRGQVELWTTPARSVAGPDDMIGQGGVFGYSSLLINKMKGPLAIAVGPVTLCQIPADEVRPLFSGLSGARFLAGELSELRLKAGESTAGHGTVDELIRSEPVVGSYEMTVRDAAAIMTERQQNYIVVPCRDGQFGVMTDSDIRSRVVASGAGGDVPVHKVMTYPAVTVRSNSPAAEALTLITDTGMTCLPVLDRGGRLLGVIGPHDFVATPSGPSMTLRRQIVMADSISQLQEHARRMPYLVGDLVYRGQPSQEITQILSFVHDSVVRRALELVLASHPELDPRAITWLSLGSNARREPVLSSDVDSAVSFDETVTAAGIALYRQAFAEVDDVLRGCGLTIDTNGAIASMPLFARTHSQWKAAAHAWLDAPLDNKGMIFISLLLDGRPIWGDRGLPAVAEVFSNLRSHPGTLRLLLAESLAIPARIRSFRDVLSRRAGMFDVKTHALTPLVNIARWSALSVESLELDTRSRLRAGSGSAMLTEDNAATLVDVFDMLQKIRLTCQLEQVRHREDPTDVLAMHRLSPLDRSLIGQGVREIAAVQRRMGNMSQYTSVSD